MATKIFTQSLKVGMFVADLDRPWVDTPFPLQGFLIENDAQIAELRTHCEFVMVDRARSTGAEFEGPASPTSTIPPAPLWRAAPVSMRADTKAAPVSSRCDEPQVIREPTEVRPQRVVRLEDVAARHGASRPGGAPLAPEGADSIGLFGRLFAGFRGRRGDRGPAPAPIEIPRETPQEFATRAALIPPGIEVQTYVDQVSVEQEVPRARTV